MCPALREVRYQFYKVSHGSDSTSMLATLNSLNCHTDHSTNALHSSGNTHADPGVFAASLLPLVRPISSHCTRFSLL